MSKKWVEVQRDLKEIYPGMTKAVFSMGKNPAYYGVEHVDRVKRIADEIEPRKENRKNPLRMYLRVNAEVYKRILPRLNGRSIQEYLHDLVLADLSRP